MFKKLTIKNFQSHLNSEFHFHPGVNVIMGTSDSGKTAVFRALKLLIQNKPLGTSFHSNFTPKEEPTEVHLTIQNNDDTTTKISRIRSEEINEYRIEGIEDPLTGFNKEVPKVVSELLNVSDINYQFQMDTPFLFGESPGTVARYLNKIVNLDKIDIALQNIASKKRQNESEIKFQQNRIEELDKSINSFPDMEAINKELSQLEITNEELKDLRYSNNTLSNLLSSIKEIDIKLNSLNTVTKLLPEIRALEKIIGEKHTLENNYDSLFKLVRELKAIDIKNNQLKEFKKYKIKVNKLNSISEEIKHMRTIKSSLSKLISNIKNCDYKIKNCHDYIETNSKKFKSLIGDICPLCDRSL